MKLKFALFVGTLILFGNLAQATCLDKELKATATANAVAVLNGFKQIELSAPLANKEEYGKYTISISGVRNGFYMQGGNYDITISDDGFCSVVSVKRGLTME